MPEGKPRILFLDIETKPALVYSFGIRDQHIGHKQIAQDGGTICVGLGWYGEDKIRVVSDWEHGHAAMIREVHTAISEADAVATYNGARFDIPKLMGDFLLEGLTPPPPPTQIDIYKAVRKLGFICNKLDYIAPLLDIYKAVRKLGFICNKLDYIAPLLGLGSKVKHEGLELWIKVMQGDEKARKRMVKYCRGDVKLTKDLYERVLPFIQDHPHLGETDRDSCGACGSSRLQSRGVRRTKAMFIARHQCQACGSWQSGRRTKAA